LPKGKPNYYGSIVPDKPYNIEGLKKYILFVGTREIYKNFYFPIHALSHLLKNDNQLQVVCTGLPFAMDELQFFKDLGIQDQIKHIYPKSDNELSWLYRNAALFIFPSLYEGFGFPMLEAFASGCPVIASIGGSLPEVGGNAAIYFEPKSIKSIQDAAQMVLYNQAERESLINKGHLQYQKFSWNKCRQETLAVYNKAYSFNR
jgi:glycosyltransferase involved in cell wall biosynthesis